MNLFGRMFQFFSQGRFDPALRDGAKSLTAVPVQPDWTPADQQNLFAFLRTQTGRRFSALLRGLEYRNALEGAKDVFHTTHSAGRTAGQGEIIDFVRTLSLASERKTEALDDPEIGESLRVESYSP